MFKDKRVLILINMIAPYRVDVLKRLSRACYKLDIVYDALREPGRMWEIDFDGLNARKSLGTLTLVGKREIDAGRSIYIHTFLLLQLVALRPDVIVANELGSRTFIACIYKMLFPKTRLVSWLTLSEWTERSRGKVRESLRKFIFRKADTFFVSGQSAKKYVQKYKPDAKIIVSPQAAGMRVASLPLQQRDSLTASSSKLKFCFIGNGSSRKNISSLISELPRWAKSRKVEISFKIVGVVNESTLDTENIQFEYLGYLGASEIETILDDSHAMLFPTLEDEWGLVVNESLGRGCPVIGSTKSEAVNELIVNGKNGWSYDPTEDGQLWDALDKLIDRLSNIGDYLKMRTDCVSSIEVASTKNFAIALSSACSD